MNAIIHVYTLHCSTQASELQKKNHNTGLVTLSFSIYGCTCMFIVFDYLHTYTVNVIYLAIITPATHPPTVA